MDSACRLCKEGFVRPLFEKNRFQLVGCQECGGAFVTTLPSPEELQAYYSLDYFKGSNAKFGYVDYVVEEPFQAESFQRKADYLNRRCSGGRVLDVGCATGSFLKQLNGHWEKYGVELSKELFEAHPPSPEISAWIGDFLQYPEEQRLFDVITMWDVLDHVPDPVATLQKAYRLLKPGGILALNVGDRESGFARLLGKRWHLYIPPTHLTFFSRRSLLRLLQAQGFHIERWEYEGKWVPLNLCLFRLSYILTAPLFQRLYQWSTRSWIGNRKVYINLRDVVTVYAMKALR